MAEILRHKKTGSLYEVLFRDVALNCVHALCDEDKIQIVRNPDEKTIEIWPIHWQTEHWEVLAEGQMQTSIPLNSGDTAAVYRSMCGEALVWARRSSEMDDGRFEPAHPDSATPSGDGAERATRGEIEGLVDQIAGIIIGPRNEVPASSKASLSDLRKVRWDRATGQEQGEARWIARSIIDQAVGPLLSRITSPSSITSGRDPSGPGSCASIEPAGAVSPAGGGFDPSRTGLPNINGRLIGAGWEKLNDGTDDRTFVVRVALGAPAPWPIRSVWESWPVSIAAQAMETEGGDRRAPGEA